VPFRFIPLGINGLVLVEPASFADERGFFMETYKESDFIKNGIAEKFVQDNYSLSVKGVIRGLHFQKDPKAQGKLVKVVTGSVLDVAVDIRKGSPTFKKWITIELSDSNQKMLYIPEGFAHGFLAQTGDVRLMYKCTAEYDPALDAGIRWNDPEIAINWPEVNPIVSDKDRALPFLKDAVVL
jgi:dTDP-4-dehydrorhamnose 3,5-epimerase